MKKLDLEQNRNGVAVFVYYAIRVIIVLSLIGFVLNADWLDAILTALILVLILTPSFLKNRYQIYIPFAFDLAAALFIFLAFFLGDLSGLYDRFSWWDGLLHFQSGLLLGLIGFLLVYILNEEKTSKLTMSPSFVAFFSFCFSLALAGLWEILEFGADSWLGTTMQESGLPDTMGDLIVNALGALIVSVLGYLWMRHRKKLPFTPH
jgi:uncharacterized membrane protein YjdF